MLGETECPRERCASRAVYLNYLVAETAVESLRCTKGGFVCPQDITDKGTAHCHLNIKQ